MNKERDISRRLVIAITITYKYTKSERRLDSLVQTTHVLSSDIGMEFGVKKCAMLMMRRRRLVRSEGIVLPDENKIRVIGENYSYKYLVF